MTERELQIELLNAEIARSDTGEQDGSTLRSVNWSVRRGDLWVVGAPPGAGKTDLLTTAAGLQRPISGELILFGYPTRGATEKDLLPHRRRIGLVLAGGGRVFSELTVAENISLPICYHTNCRADAATERVAQYLIATELQDLADLLPNRVPRWLLSRIALARALALTPEVLLLDNPLAGLDPRQSRWWLDFLRSLTTGHALYGGKPITIAVTADDLRPWLEFGTHFAVLKERRWIEIGDRVQVEGSSDEFVQEMLGVYAV